jgi:hypothetical protein
VFGDDLIGFVASAVSGSFRAASGTNHASAARSAAHSEAEKLERVQDGAQIFATPLWPGGKVPEGLSAALDTLHAFWDADPETWGFWRRWYDGMLAGQPLPWDLQEQVALLPDDIWQAGPEAVAERIAAIEKELQGEPLDQDALRAHAERLTSAPMLHADAAEATANLIEDAILRYKVEAPANVLPEGYRSFETLGPAFRSISVVLSSDRTKDEKIAALQAEINGLHATIQQLRNDLREARDQLRDVRLDRLEAQQMRTFGEKLQTTLTNVTLIGTIGMSSLTFFGVRAEDLGYDALKSLLCGLAEDMCRVEAPGDLPEGPDIVET